MCAASLAYIAVHICPLKLQFFHHFHTYSPYPFRYLFNLIWFQFQVFSRRVSVSLSFCYYFYCVSHSVSLIDRWADLCTCLSLFRANNLFCFHSFEHCVLFCSIIWNWLNQARELVFSLRLQSIVFCSVLLLPHKQSLWYFLIYWMQKSIVRHNRSLLPPRNSTEYIECYK